MYYRVNECIFLYSYFKLKKVKNIFSITAPFNLYKITIYQMFSLYVYKLYILQFYTYYECLLLTLDELLKCS